MGKFNMKQNLSKLSATLYLKCFIFIPIPIIIGLGVFYIFLLIKEPYSMEREKVLFGIDIISATLAGLIFYASSAAKDIDKKRMYYVDAERFLHATILMSVATILEGGVILVGSSGQQYLFKGVSSFILIFSTIIFFLLSLQNLTIGLFSMMKNMYLKAGIF